LYTGKQLEVILHLGKPLRISKVQALLLIMPGLNLALIVQAMLLIYQ